MCRAVIFGGTTEGRRLCEFCAGDSIPIIYCVATADGADAAAGLAGTTALIGRQTAEDMAELFVREKPEIVVDATHPYAAEVSKNIAVACGKTGVQLIRVVREGAMPNGCITISGTDELLSYLEKTPGNIFATTGASSALTLAKLADFQRRVWLRILPSMESLRICLEHDYKPDRLICMQGPFSKELNRAMFEAADARILITKDGGAAGGFPEKLAAAKSLNMEVAVLAKPAESGGMTIAAACERLMKLKI